MEKTKEKLSAELVEFIEEWKNREGNLIPILHKVQEIYGYIPEDVAMEVAKMINVPLAKIYGVATFYHFFKLKKPGKHKISVCMGTACYLKGGNELLEELKNLLDVEVGDTCANGIFSLEAVRCIGCCGLAPVIMIDEEVYGKVTKDDLPSILAKYTKDK